MKGAVYLKGEREKRGELMGFHMNQTSSNESLVHSIH